MGEGETTILWKKKRTKEVQVQSGTGCSQQINMGNHYILTPKQELTASRLLPVIINNNKMLIFLYELHFRSVN